MVNGEWWMVNGGWWILRLRIAKGDATRTVRVVDGDIDRLFIGWEESI